MDLKQFAIPEGSSMVKMMNDLYISYGQHLDFTYGYPERVNPLWIRKLQTFVPEEVFLKDDGTKKFIEEIEKYFLDLFNASNISIVPSAGFAFCFVCDALIQHLDDEIILQDISFEPYPKIVESYKGKAVVVARNSDHTLNVENIKNAYTKNTKAIVIVNPDNPLGLIYSEGDMEELVAFCIEKDITLVVDYTFFQISPFGKKIPLITTLKGVYQLSYILIGDTGKILGLKGSKFGVLLYSDGWAEIFIEVISNYLFQHNQYNLYLIATILTDKKFNAYLNYLNELVADNYFLIKSKLHPTLKLLSLDATVFCVIDIEATGSSDIALAYTLIARGIGVIPMSYFHHNSKKASGNFIRVSLARPSGEIKKFVGVMSDLMRLMH